MRWRERVRAWVPSRAQISENRWLRWLSPWLRQPRLWRWSRRGVAMGVALGIFFGLLIPVAQIPLSVAAAVLLRANVAAAAVSTLVTNPLTFGPVYYAAYRLGHWITGEPTPLLKLPPEAIPPDLPREDVRLWQRITTVGKPLLLGLAIIASVMGVLSYMLIALAWRAWRWYTRRNRRLP